MIKSNLFYYIKKRTGTKVLVLFLAQMKRSPGSLSRSPARTRAPKQSTGLFLCFALPFSNLFYYIKKRTSTKVLVLFLAQMKSSPGSLSRSPARTRAPKQSTGLFLCFALPFSNLFYYIKKRTSTKVLVLFLAQMKRFARLAFTLAGTHPGTETVHRTVSMLRIALFESLLLY